MLSKRWLTKTDEKQLLLLIDDIENGLINKDYWLPIRDESRKHFLNPDWTHFIGVFDENKLVAASALFLNPFDYEETARAIGKRVVVDVSEDAWFQKAIEGII